MKQKKSFASSGFELVTKRTRKREFLAEMNSVVPALVSLIEPHAPSGKTGRPPFALLILLRIHFMQQWFGLSDPAMEEALHDIPLYCEFAQLDAAITRLPDESTTLRFRHLLEAHNLSAQLLATINATLIKALSTTKNDKGERDPEMRQTKKDNQWYFGMKALQGVDAESGLVHAVMTTPANAHDVTQAYALLHGQEKIVFADSGYRGIEKRQKIQDKHAKLDLQIAMMPGKRKALDKTKASHAAKDKLEKPKAGVRAKVEHPFRAIKCQFGFTKDRYKGLAKNTAQLMTLFALGNLWMARKRIIQGALG